MSVDVIQNDLKRNEITLVSIVNLFPLRFLRPVAMLRDRYEKRVESGGARARLEVHLEGDGTRPAKAFRSERSSASHRGLALLNPGQVHGDRRAGWRQFRQISTPTADQGHRRLRQPGSAPG